MTQPNFSLQIHPDRAPGLDLTAIRNICERIARDTDIVSRFSFVKGDDERAYVNVNFATNDRRTLWRRLQAELYDGVDGSALKQASMVMCEGQHGWDDYLLLHHYDPAAACDALPDGD
jgi:hypothetical protein